jgi:MFS superfamily sulfate permease-like transporter
VADITPGLPDLGMPDIGLDDAADLALPAVGLALVAFGDTTSTASST